MHTWSAPASRCASTRALIASTSPHATIASTSRSLPPSAKSSSSKPKPLQVVRVVRQRQVHRRVVARAVAPCVDAVGLEHDRLLAADQRVGTDRSRGLRATCSGGTKYGCTPAARSRASPSIRGPSAASTRASTGSGALGGVETVEVLDHLRVRLRVAAGIARGRSAARGSRRDRGGTARCHVVVPRRAPSPRPRPARASRC